MTVSSSASAAMDRVRLRALRKSVPPDEASLIPAGTALSRTVRTSTARPAAVLVVPSVRPDALFAGLGTALDVAASIAQRTSLPLHILTLDAPSARSTEESRALIARRTGLDRHQVGIATAWRRGRPAHPSDIWIATYHATAHAIDRACHRGVIARDRVIYIVQDHEPSFFPASTERLVAEQGYRAGFRLLVNSEPLRRYLVEHSDARGVSVDRTFRPALDEPALRLTASQRVRSEVLRIGFYARPSKPRNAFDLGRATLQVAGEQLREAGIEVEFHTVGELHRPFSVAGRPVVPVGRLPWAESFHMLTRTDVFLSLQLTPHPSHPPLDAVVSGGLAVTNDVGSSRTGLSPRLLAGKAEPDALAELVCEAARQAIEAGPAEFDNDLLTELGRPLDDAVTACLRGLR
jgi:hypothetical protein